MRLRIGSIGLSPLSVAAIRIQAENRDVWNRICSAKVMLRSCYNATRFCRCTARRGEVHRKAVEPEEKHSAGVRNTNGVTLREWRASLNRHGFVNSSNWPEMEHERGHWGDAIGQAHQFHIMNR
jgi:hypothetical protein